MSHYHVECPWLSDEACNSVFEDIFSALDYMADEFGRIGDYEHESISLLGESELYKEAFEAWQTTETLSFVQLSLEILVGMANGTRDKAPVYQGEDGDQLLKERAEKILPFGKWNRDGGHLFDPLPLKYTPDFYRCPIADNCCEHWLEYQEEIND